MPGAAYVGRTTVATSLGVTAPPGGWPTGWAIPTSSSGPWPPGWPITGSCASTNSWDDGYLTDYTLDPASPATPTALNNYWTISNCPGSLVGKTYSGSDGCLYLITSVDGIITAGSGTISSPYRNGCRINSTSLLSSGG